MNRPMPAEPFVGEELISISISLYKVEFEFQSDVLHVTGDFVLSRSDGVNEIFRPRDHSGNVQSLWSLIGHLATGVEWSDTVTLFFDDGSHIQILPSDAGFRGTIHGKFPAPGTLMIEDF